MDPAFEHVPEDALPVIEGHHARARVIMGRLWGQSAPVTTHANTIYADISLQPGGAAPIDADADERAVYLAGGDAARSEEHTSELQSLMRNSYAVFCFKIKTYYQCGIIM